MGHPSLPRLHKELFSEVMRLGRRLSTDHLSVRVLKKTALQSHFAFVSPATYSKGAVLRNRFRRRGRAIIEKYRSRIRPNYSVIFFAKKGAESMPFNEFEQEVVSILHTLTIVHHD